MHIKDITAIFELVKKNFFNALVFKETHGHMTSLNPVNIERLCCTVLSLDWSKETDDSLLTGLQGEWLLIMFQSLSNPIASMGVF